MDLNQPQYSIDYLNNIAPARQKPPVNKRLLILVAGGGVVLLIILGFIFAALLNGGGSGDKLQTLAARLQTLQTVAHDAQVNIKSNDLRTTNSSLDIYLANANRDIATQLESRGINPEKLDKSIVTREAGTELIATLDDARLNAVYDRTYAREMSYQLATVAALIADIDASTNNTALKKYLDTTQANLTPIEEQLANFIGSAS
jgi:hypothetical protein